MAHKKPQQAEELSEILDTAESPEQIASELETLAQTQLAEVEAALEEEISNTFPAEEVTLDLAPEQQSHITAAMEALLFMSDKPVSLPKLRALIDSNTPLSAYRALMTKLREEYAAAHRGIDIAEVSMGFQLRTKPQMAPVLRNLVKTVPLKLTNAMMEVLAVVAYKQPVTKDELDQIRGVDCSYLLRSLMEKHLIRISGRSDLPGRPMLYSTSHEFLELFSLKDLKSLPPLHEIEAMVATSEAGDEVREQEEMVTFGKMVDSALTEPLFDDSRLDEELDDIRRTIEAIPTSTEFIDEQKALEKNHIPSPELVAAAEAAQTERHTEMIQEAIGEATPTQPLQPTETTTQIPDNPQPPSKSEPATDL